ncbi:hypothetical protein PF005_g24449 [Phytophthora fragariae]|uniref:Uncharacterized protein n=1 Tax=Phytophthora fragariae TaxID=53985 RepID=A0A6A3ICA3_9STRA|nr:hypothetical protein PF003_g30869 [Phytophthora fragariae]KAE8925202.1 hypothetical protein PF009_g24578 [Phytophthora fragariae]KAE8979112.1 hypothetical protein PF011_g22979 [Phytophthora fragariae]KAE9075237.1 hypothetical protein PF010_g24381 [Phytophthora fragariae]KAE9078456.1 hypothetical protein PF007_g23852 [Phytophthora fragariae]
MPGIGHFWSLLVTFGVFWSRDIPDNTGQAPKNGRTKPKFTGVKYTVPYNFCPSGPSKLHYTEIK